jgi:hypothetical protein
MLRTSANKQYEACCDDETISIAANPEVLFLLSTLLRYSTQKVKHWKFRNDRNKYQINVRGLHKGMYTLVITIGKYKRAKQLLITE